MIFILLRKKPYNVNRETSRNQNEPTVPRSLIQQEVWKHKFTCESIYTYSAQFCSCDETTVSGNILSTLSSNLLLNNT